MSHHLDWLSGHGSCRSDVVALSMKGKGSELPRKALYGWIAPLRWKSVLQVVRLSQNFSFISTQGFPSSRKLFLYTETILDTPSPAVYNSRNDA